MRNFSFGLGANSGYVAMINDGENKGEQQRQALNAWIHTGAAFDGVFDFDEAVRDSSQPARLLPAYDSGDHLHPSDAGYKVIAAIVDVPAVLAATW